MPSWPPCDLMVTLLRGYPFSPDLRSFCLIPFAFCVSHPPLLTLTSFGLFRQKCFQSHLPLLPTLLLWQGDLRPAGQALSTPRGPGTPLLKQAHACSYMHTRSNFYTCSPRSARVHAHTYVCSCGLMLVHGGPVSAHRGRKGKLSETHCVQKVKVRR